MLVLQLYILLQRVSFFCAIFWICSFIVIKLLSEDHQLSAVKLAKKIGVASRNIENNIKKLKEYGILIRHGSPKNGYWEIVDKDLQE